MELLKIITAIIACGAAFAIPITLLIVFDKRGREARK